MKLVHLTSWRPRVLQAYRSVYQRIPFSREHGRQACRQGKGAVWFRRSEEAALWLDGMTIFLLFCAALAALPAILWYSRWLAIVSTSIMGFAMFNMAAELWIEREASEAREEEYRRDPSSPNLRVFEEND